MDVGIPSPSFECICFVQNSSFDHMGGKENNYEPVWVLMGNCAHLASGWNGSCK